MNEITENIKRKQGHWEKQYKNDVSSCKLYRFIHWRENKAAAIKGSFQNIHSKSEKVNTHSDHKNANQSTWDIRVLLWRTIGKYNNDINP